MSTEKKNPVQEALDRAAAKKSGTATAKPVTEKNEKTAAVVDGKVGLVEKERELVDGDHKSLQDEVDAAKDNDPKVEKAVDNVDAPGVIPPPKSVTEANSPAPGVGTGPEESVDSVPESEKNPVKYDTSNPEINRDHVSVNTVRTDGREVLTDTVRVQPPEPGVVEAGDSRHPRTSKVDGMGGYGAQGWGSKP